jgi:hypothetical protein
MHIITSFRERFIPITRRSIIRHLMQEEGVLIDAERKIFEKFALALDGALTNRYHGTLEELKVSTGHQSFATTCWSLL